MEEQQPLNQDSANTSGGSGDGGDNGSSAGDNSASSNSAADGGGGTGTGIGEPRTTPSETDALAFSKSDEAQSDNPGSSTNPFSQPLPTGDPPPPSDGSGIKPGGPLDTILHMGPPSSPPPEGQGQEGRSEKHPPHLVPPPYVHHFDSYSLVKQLSDAGYTVPQSIEAMKAVRSLLAANLDVAQESLVSKLDVENEAYLFRAACSELGTEVRNNRRIADEALRQQRTHLQHEVDNLTQRLNQELLMLTDSVRGMFNDRKMAVREEQRAVDSKVCLPPFPVPNPIHITNTSPLDPTA